MRLAVIPARGGSKRIPRKNLKPFCGRPIIAYSIGAALDSGLFDHVIVSTDDPEIAEVSRRFGAETPFVRPPELADDHATTIEVIRHAITASEEALGREVGIACCLYATAPFVDPRSLAAGFEALIAAPTAAFAVPLTTFAFPIHRAVVVREDGTIAMLWPEHQKTRSQDLPEAYHDAGQFYWGRRPGFFRHDGFFGPHAVPVLLPRKRVQDIDTEEDWAFAERLFRAGDDE